MNIIIKFLLIAFCFVLIGCSSKDKKEVSIIEERDLDLQMIATNSLRNGLISYDQTKAWRGPITNKIYNSDWNKKLDKFYFSLC